MRHRIDRVLFLCVLACPTLGVGLLLPLAPSADATNSLFFAANGPTYAVRHGLLTLEGISGIFLNPTSATLSQGRFDAQYCVALLNLDEVEAQHMASVAYGVSDWFEVGIHGRLSDFEGETIGGGGIYLRLRVLKDDRWWPELSVGGVVREGNQNIVRRTLFVAASKGVTLSRGLFFHTFRLHAGFRQYWQDSDVNDSSTLLGFIAGELALYDSISFATEVSTQSDVGAKIPFSFGVQIRHASGFIFRLGGLQFGRDDEGIGLYTGIGIRFK